MTETATIDKGHNLPDRAQMIRDDLVEIASPLERRRDELLAAVDRVPAEVDSDDLAGKIADFIKQITAAMKSAEAARVAAKEPHLEAGRIVDGMFKKITDPLDGAKRRIEQRLTLWQRKKAEEERRRREQAERAAREEAERAAKEAAERAAALKTEADLDAALNAEALAAQAAADAERAKKAAEAKAADMSRQRGDYGAVASLRTFWDFRDLDRNTLNLEALRSHLPIDGIERAIRSYIKAGGRDLQGVEIFENTASVVR